jgi:phosphoserine phosphatase|tara:strand:+ start:190 stop:372 length:183 start_codon:yes stop_codon:yes gene_type:complete
MKQVNIDETIAEVLNINAIITLINQKFAVNCDNHDKAEVLTEVLNDVKLLLTPTANAEIH